MMSDESIESNLELSLLNWSLRPQVEELIEADVDARLVQEEHLLDGCQGNDLVLIFFLILVVDTNTVDIRGTVRLTDL